jgi:hypothetical protein
MASSLALELQVRGVRAAIILERAAPTVFEGARMRPQHSCVEFTGARSERYLLYVLLKLTVMAMLSSD